jgi:hypothetical protein
MPILKSHISLFPYGPQCKEIKGEVTESMAAYLIESGHAVAEDFEQVEVKETKSKTKKNQK